eukprot:TRINITY_DN6557_c0_g2_i1.p1 TRINITY_DN6557_c0_g2~~TRINITY_DN6557_c0_g2_i1.p1  ORF type:complete len:322 (-),score=39.60 TRINITY_DN6557_c0_g2_i1:398-1363(-)
MDIRGSLNEIAPRASMKRKDCVLAQAEKEVLALMSTISITSPKRARFAEFPSAWMRTPEFMDESSAGSYSPSQQEDTGESCGGTESLPFDQRRLQQSNAAGSYFENESTAFCARAASFPIQSGLVNGPSTGVLNGFSSTATVCMSELDSTAERNSSAVLFRALDLPGFPSDDPTLLGASRRLYRASSCSSLPFSNFHSHSTVPAKASCNAMEDDPPVTGNRKHVESVDLGLLRWKPKPVLVHTSRPQISEVHEVYGDYSEVTSSHRQGSRNLEDDSASTERHSLGDGGRRTFSNGGVVDAKGISGRQMKPKRRNGLHMMGR